MREWMRIDMRCGEANLPCSNSCFNVERSWRGIEGVDEAEEPILQKDTLEINYFILAPYHWRVSVKEQVIVTPPSCVNFIAFESRLEMI
jgi:hypothetical protein